VTDLGHEATDEMLAALFRRWASFARARVVRDKFKPDKTKGYGFVSFLDPWEAMAALKEKQGAYCGGRPIKLQRSKWGDKDADVHKAKEKEREKRRLTGGV
jgi:RNA recognition motif-containing protein